MAGKRLFQILDEMNLEDIENGGRLVSVSGHFISADKVKKGTKVSMGTDDSAIFDLANDDVIPLLILVNKKEYNKRIKT